MQQALKSHRLYTLISLFITLTIGLGIIIVPIEKNLDRHTPFETTEDGIWWSITTVTGVGYGDFVPITSVGRLIGVILETIGVTSFGLIIAFITISMLRKEQQYYWSRTTTRFDRLEEKLDKIDKSQAFTIKENGHSKPPHRIK